MKIPIIWVTKKIHSDTLSKVDHGNCLFWLET
jgi:hypothetical protein